MRILTNEEEQEADMHNVTVNCSEESIVNCSLTNDSVVCIELPRKLRIVSEVASSVTCVLALYVIVNLTHHFYKERKTLDRKLVGSFYGRNLTQFGEKACISTLSLLTLNAAIAIAVRCAIDIVVLERGLRNRDYVVMTSIEILLNVAALSSIYLVLWIRQWMFYNHPATKDLRLEKLRVLCWILIVFMVITGLWNAIAFISKRNLDYNAENECFVKIESPWNVVKFYSLTACQLLYQIVLLGLFANPLIRHANGNTVKFSNKKRLLLRVLQRVFVAAIICCVTDLLTGICSVVSENAYPESSFLIYNINLLINFACLLYTFSDWRTRLSSPCSVCREDGLPAPPLSTVIDSNVNTSAV